MVAADPANASARTNLAIALFRLSFPLARNDPVEAVTVARRSVGLFDREIATGNKSYLVICRPGAAPLC